MHSSFLSKSGLINISWCKDKLFLFHREKCIDLSDISCTCLYLSSPILIDSFKPVLYCKNNNNNNNKKKKATSV